MTYKLMRNWNFAMKVLQSGAAVLLLAEPVTVGVLLGQDANRQEFEVASVKPNVAGVSGTLESVPGNPGWIVVNRPHRLDASHGNLKAVNTSMRELIAFAYSIPDLLISGPSWMGDQRYDIDAKGAAGASASTVAAMLRTLLGDRFHLQVHREAKDMSTYSLLVAAGGLKAQPTDPSAAPRPLRAIPGGPFIIRRNCSMAELAELLSGVTGRPVIDHTGTAGSFYFEFGYDPHSNSTGTDIRAALLEQVGLRLEGAKRSLEMLVVDHAERVPTEN